jgi:hypothetical protein
MNLIGDLRIAVPGGWSKQRYGRFQDLADELAIEIRPVWLRNPASPDNDDVSRQLNALLEHSDAFYIHNWQYFQDQAIRDKILQRIKAGIRVLVDTDTTSDKDESELNSFLSSYGAEATKIGIFRTDRPTDRSFEFIRDVHPECFRDPELFAGVANFSVSAPRLIRYTGNTSPVAVLPPRDEVMLIDLTTDLQHHWHTRELAYIVKHTDPETSVRLLAFSGSILGDRKLERPGNRKFAENLLRWATGKLGTKPTAKDYLDQIEISLYDTINSVLSRKSKTWDIDCVPDKVMEKCQSKMTGERGSKPQAYFDLVDLKKTIAHNWPMFEPHFIGVGWAGGKSKALDWLDRVIEIRKLSAHPVKAHVLETRLNNDDCDFLEYCARQTALLLKAVVE